MTTHLKMLTGLGGALKSIPLSGVNGEMWQSWYGGGSFDIVELYEHVPWLRRAVDARCNAVASMPFVFQRLRDGAELPAGELPPLSFALDLPELLDRLEGWYILHGAAYVFVQRNAYNLVKGLQAMHPKTIEPVFTAREGLVGFKRRINGIEIALDVNELAKLWVTSRRAESGPGAAAALAALGAAGVLRHGDEFADIYFQQAPIAPTLIEVAQAQNDSDLQRLQSWLDKSVKGVKNAFRALGIRSGLKVHQLTMIEMSKLAMAELTDKKREDIATALGVPQTILFSNAANYATAEQDDFHFYDKTVIPDCRRIESALNPLCFEPMGYRLIFRETQLELYQKLTMKAAIERVVPLVEKKIITVDEAREEVGYEVLTTEQRDELKPAPAPMLPAPLANEQNPIVEGKSAPHPPTCGCNACRAGRNVQDDAWRDDLRRWRRMAVKRWDEGKPERALDFESDVLGVYVQEYVKGALDAATDVDAVKRVFSHAEEWAGYP